MMCHNNFQDAIEWLNSPETSLQTSDDEFYESNRSNINVSTRILPHSIMIFSF